MFVLLLIDTFFVEISVAYRGTFPNFIRLELASSLVFGWCLLRRIVVELANPLRLIILLSVLGSISALKSVHDIFLNYWCFLQIRISSLPLSTSWRLNLIWLPLNWRLPFTRLMLLICCIILEDPLVFKWDQISIGPLEWRLSRLHQIQLIGHTTPCHCITPRRPNYKLNILCTRLKLLKSLCVLQKQTIDHSNLVSRCRISRRLWNFLVASIHGWWEENLCGVLRHSSFGVVIILGIFLNLIC